jgi:cephalosporin hydroxylase
MNRKQLVSNIIQNLNGVYVEIGTDKGDFADFLLENSQCKKLYCVDPYTSYSEYKDSINNTTGNKLYNEVKLKLITRHGDRVEIIKNFSRYASTYLPNDLDFVYLDGNHSYKYVLEDLESWYPKVRKGGYIVGDDVVDKDSNERDNEGNVYIKWGENCEGYYGVYKALTDFCNKYDIKYHIQEGQFIIKK